MKKSNIFKLITCLLIISVLTIITGCGSDEADEPVVNPIEVTISIDYPEKSKAVDIKEETFKVEEESSVLEALQIYCNVNEIPLTVETNSRTVHGIDNIDNGISARYWKYTLNGEKGVLPESEQILEDGDIIEWEFTK